MGISSNLNFEKIEKIKPKKKKLESFNDVKIIFLILFKMGKHYTNKEWLRNGNLKT